MRRKKTRKFITSGGKEYVSGGVAGRHSPFAAKFIEALLSNGGDDRIVTMNEILAFLERLKRMNHVQVILVMLRNLQFVFVAKQ